MNTHETYVSFETAKLLKEAKFDWECNYAYTFSDNEVTNKAFLSNWSDTFIDAPTLAVAQKWLREVKGIFICVIPEIKDYNTTWNFYICNEQGLFYENEDCFLTYEEAKEAGIKSILKLILGEGELLC